MAISDDPANPTVTSASTVASGISTNSIATAISTSNVTTTISTTYTTSTSDVTTSGFNVTSSNLASFDKLQCTANNILLPKS